MAREMSKVLLDKAIEQARHYYDAEVPYEAKDVHAFLRATQAVYGESYSIIMSDFLASILAHSGLKHDATNEDIYKALEVLGWQVINDEQAEC